MNEDSVLLRDTEQLLEKEALTRGCQEEKKVIKKSERCLAVSRPHSICVDVYMCITSSRSLRMSSVSL